VVRKLVRRLDGDLRPVTPHPPKRTLEERGRRLIERLRADFIERTKARRRSAERDRGSERDAWGQIPCLILSLPIAGLFVVAVLVGMYALSARVADWMTSAFLTPPGLGIGGILAILAGAWVAMRIVTGKSAPGTTRAAKLLGLGMAASLGVLGAALLLAAINRQSGASTF
jgi:hypothetical protein